jgi:hypothetical protein
LPEFGLERFIDKFNEKISIITSEMKSYTYHFFTGENMVNNSSMCKHPTALTRISTQTFLFNQRSYKKGIRQIKMAKAAIVTGPRRKLAVKFLFAHSVCPDLCQVCLLDTKSFCGKVINWSTKVPYSEFSPCTQRDPYVP